MIVYSGVWLFWEELTLRCEGLGSDEEADGNGEITIGADAIRSEYCMGLDGRLPDLGSEEVGSENFHIFSNSSEEALGYFRGDIFFTSEETDLADLNGV